MSDRNLKQPVIKVRYHADIDRIQKIAVGDWIDLRTAEDVFIPKWQLRIISLGVSMKLPDGYEAHIIPRSSTFSKYGIILANSYGLIDNAYCGDNDIWRFPAYCLDGKEMRDGWFGTFIPKNTRICQFRIVEKQPYVVFAEVDHLDGPDRGGFGSTGSV